jgi:hypothetical protein
LLCNLLFTFYFYQFDQLSRVFSNTNNRGYLIEFINPLLFLETIYHHSRQFICLILLVCQLHNQDILTDLNTIRVIPLCGMVDEWPIWSEQVLAKAKIYGINKLLLRKLSIPKTDENFVIPDEGKKKLKTTELNEIAIFTFFCTFDAPNNLALSKNQRNEGTSSLMLPKLRGRRRLLQSVAIFLKSLVKAQTPGLVSAGGITYGSLFTCDTYKSLRATS